MKNFPKTALAFALAFALSPCSFAQNQPPLSAPVALPPLPSGTVGLDMSAPVQLSSPTGVQLDAVPLSQVVQLFYANSSRQYFMSPEVVMDTSPVSFRFDGDIQRKFFMLLASRGYSVQDRGGVDFIGRTEIPTPPDSKPFIYFTKYRSPIDLSRSLQQFFKGRFGAIGGVQTAVPTHPDQQVSQSSATASLDVSMEYLTFYGPQVEIDQLKHLLSLIDVPQPSVEIKAVVYEVSVSSGSGSSLNIIGEKLGSSGIGFSLNSGSPLQNASTLSISAGGFSLVYSSLLNDSRFTVLSSPVLRVLSGKTSTLTVGQEVPVLGSVSYTEGSSTPVQSVEYRQSGAIFSVSPTIYKDQIQLTVRQELSDFADTTVSRIDSPTIFTRKIDSTLTIRPGEIIFIGGIDSGKTSTSKGGRWIFRNRQRSQSNSQLVLMLQAIPISQPTGVP